MCTSDGDAAPRDDFDRRGITLTRVGGTVVLRGRLDAEGAAALQAALDAICGPPGPGETRTPAQLRADALVELARGALRAGRLPETGGERPQIGVLLTPRHLIGGAARPAWLEGLGAVPETLAQRLACDADVWRAVLDPATGEPLELGRAHRVVPTWLRKALRVRDGGCVFPACNAPVGWTDAHHLTAWARGGRTELANLVLLCRPHHRLVHEGGWSIARDPGSGVVTVRRPDGGVAAPPGRAAPSRNGSAGALAA